MLFFSLAAKIAAAAKKKRPMATTAELSENSHQGFEGLKAALCLASMEAKSNNVSGLQACLRQDRIGSRCSGKERDETNLDYFGARYLSSAMGRWTSPDPLLNSGRPDIPQSWNRYNYVSNNPLKFVDPTGLYEWAAVCKQDDDICNGQRQWFRNALAKVNEALAKADPGSLEYWDLLATSKWYGTEGDKRGPTVGFDETIKMPANTSLDGDITFNTKLIIDHAKSWEAAGADVDVESAAAVAHEGFHAFSIYGIGTHFDYTRILIDEIGAYRTHSAVNKIFNTQSSYKLWNPSGL